MVYHQFVQRGALWVLIASLTVTQVVHRSLIECRIFALQSALIKNIIDIINPTSISWVWSRTKMISFSTSKGSTNCKQSTMSLIPDAIMNSFPNTRMSVISKDFSVWFSKWFRVHYQIMVSRNEPKTRPGPDWLTLAWIFLRVIVAWIWAYF